MFQAGVVAPSSVLLLQLLTYPDGLEYPPLVEEVESEDRLGLPRPPVREGRVGVAELPALELLIPRGREYLLLVAEKLPVLCGLNVPIFVLYPMALENLSGLVSCARLLNAVIHCNT